MYTFVYKYYTKGEQQIAFMLAGCLVHLIKNLSKWFLKIEAKWTQKHL